jgi:hypothetical protein
VNGSLLIEEIAKQAGRAGLEDNAKSQYADPLAGVIILIQVQPKPFGTNILC